MEHTYLGEGTPVSLSASVGKIVRPNWLERSLDRLRQLSDGLEVLVGGPAFW